MPYSGTLHASHRASRCSRSICRGVIADVGRSPGPALLAIRSQRHDLVGAALARRAVKINVSPRIARHGAGLEIGSVPNRCIAWSLRQCGKTFTDGRIPADVEIEQVERAGEALDLEFGRLHFGVPEVVEYAGTNQA